ncbi:MAG: glycosyltransferase family 4 protein [Gaiellaceae bacterium]
MTRAAEKPHRRDVVPGVLRVLILFHEDELLGAGTSVLRAIDELEMYGWTASGWVPGQGPLLPEAKKHLASVEVAERPIAVSRRGWQEAPGIRARAARTPAYARALRKTLMRIRPHVVHANTLLSLPEAVIARSCGIPVVLHVHEIPPPGAKRTATVRLAARVADVLVGVSDAVATMLRPLAGTTPVLTVRNGVPTFSGEAVAGERPFTVGTVGTVSRTKGTDIYVRAAQLALEQRPSMRFEHVGARDLHRDAGLDVEIDGLLAEVRPSGTIHMRGTLPAETVLGGWDTFVLASRSEGCPLVTLEAMAAGLPVVATAVGGVPEQIGHLESGILVSPDDPAAIASWLVRLHDEPGLRQRLGVNAAARARSEFTLASQAEGLHQAYLAALDLRFGPPVVRRAVRAGT